MHLRRSLLLFAIVLALAALAASFTRPARERQAGREEPAPSRGAPQRETPTASPGPGRTEPARLRFNAGRRNRTLRLETGRPATVIVEAGAPGHVELTGLGLSSPVTPAAPARFEVLASRPGRHAVRFTRAGQPESRTIGTLVVRRQAND